jgi:hypothetical protein
VTEASVPVDVLGRVIEMRATALERLLKAQIAMIEHAAEVQTHECERRFESIDRDRREQNQIAAQSRIQAESAAATNRRNTALTMIMAAIPMISVLVTIVLHFR